MTVPGWIKLYRKITECEIWKDDDPFSKRDAWIDILLLCNFEDKKAVIGMKPVVVKRGTFLTSQDHLSVRWHWSRQRVRSYIKLLVELQMITIEATNRYTIIKVPNYEGYQGFEEEKNLQNNQPSNTQATIKQPTDNQQITTTKEYKEYKEGKEDKKSSSSSSNTKYISKGDEDDKNNLFRQIEYTLKMPITQFLADKFLTLREEVGIEALKEALEITAQHGARNYAYVEAVARSIANGGNVKKGTGKLDFEGAMEMAIAAMEEKKNA